MKDKRFTLNSSANLTGTLSGALKGPKGDKGDPGSTDYNQLENKPDLSVYALKDELPNAGITDYNELQNKPDLSVYALKNELEELRKVVDGIVISTNNSYSVYTIDNSVSTFGMRRSVGETIKEGPYIPELSNGYHYIVLTLNDGNKTTNIDTLAADVKEVKIYYPDDTSYIKFANTKVKDVIELKAQNITDATGMFTNCISLQSADLTQLPSNAIVDHTMFEGVPSSSQIKVANDFNGNNSGFTGQFIQYISGFGLSTSELEITEEGIRHFVYIYPNEAGRIMDFDVWFDNSETEIQYQTYFDAGTPTIEVWVNNSQQTSNTLVVCEKNSGFKNYLRINVNVAEEPKENYITYFALNESSIELNFPGVEKQVGFTLHDYERAYPMNFVIVSDHDFSLNTDLENNTFYISTNGLDNRTHNVTIRETYSGLEQTLQVALKQYVGLTVHYKSTDGNYAGDSLVLGNDYSLTFDLSQECDSYGVYAMIYLPIGTYSMHLVNEGFESPQFDRELILTTDTEIWINDTEFTYYDHEPDIPDQPTQEYITGFTLDSGNSITLTDTNPFKKMIYPNETGRPMNFIVEFPEEGDWSAVTYRYVANEDINEYYIEFRLMTLSTPDQSSKIINVVETNSQCKQELYLSIIPEDRLIVHYKSTDGDVSNDRIRFSHSTGSVLKDLVVGYPPCTDDYGYVNEYGIVLALNNIYTLTLLNNDIEGPEFNKPLDLRSVKEIWINDTEATYYEYNPDSSEPEEPTQEYISGFDVDPTIDSFVFDSVDNRTLNLNIYPYEQGRQVSFSVYLEDSTLANSDTLYPSIDTYEYDNGYNNAIYCSVNLQIDDDLGTATLVIRESNSEIEKRISVSVAEPQPKITDFTISPESLTFSDDGNKIATVTIIPAETDRAMRFSYGIGSQSQFNITPDESEAPNKYYVNIEATQLYKEEYEPVFYVNEERSGISKSIPVTIESENVWVNPNAWVKVYYNRADGNYDNITVSFYSIEDIDSSITGFYNSDDNGQYADYWLAKGKPYRITVFDNGSESELASGEFTFTEDTSLWVVEGDSTIYTEKPEI